MTDLIRNAYIEAYNDTMESLVEGFDGAKDLAESGTPWATIGLEDLVATKTHEAFAAAQRDAAEHSEQVRDLLAREAEIEADEAEEDEVDEYEDTTLGKYTLVSLNRHFDAAERFLQVCGFNDDDLETFIENARNMSGEVEGEITADWTNVKNGNVFAINQAEPGSLALFVKQVR